jgi:glycosyltransferase involved in cell wall biosynthesis
MNKVTVITSVFKASSHLSGFMEDITEQTAFDQCQWYLLDAASPDNEIETIEPYLKHDNIHYERLEEDPGIYACWNHMIENSESEYITNANTDDRLFPEFIEKMVEALDQNPSKDLVYSENIMSSNPSDSHKNYTEDTEASLYPCGPFDRKGMVRHNYPHCHPVWRRSLHDRFGLFNPEYKSAGDYEFWLRCLLGGSEDFLYLPEILAIYYFNPEGISTDPSSQRWRHKEEIEIKRKYISQTYPEFRISDDGTIHRPE